MEPSFRTTELPPTPQGSSRRSARREILTLWAFGVREYRIWQSYRVNQALWMANIFVTSLMFFLMGKMIAGRAASLMGAAYGSDYMSFIVVGLTVNTFINTNLSDPYTRIARSYFNGTMDLYLLSPMSVYTPLLGLMTKSFIDDYPRLFFVGGFGMLLFGARFNFQHWAVGFWITLLFLAAGFGVGMISASSFYLLNIKKGTEPVRFIVQELLATLLAGAYYPVAILPKPLQWVACLIPHTYAFDALRRLFDPGAKIQVPALPIQRIWPVSPMVVDEVALALFAVILVPLGVFLYGRGIEKARREGTLTRWQ
ncbi:MAG: ABC transporter permease [Sulfobacillus sp.]